MFFCPLCRFIKKRIFNYIGEQRGARTHDPQIKSFVLHQPISFGDGHGNKCKWKGWGDKQTSTLKTRGWTGN